MSINQVPLNFTSGSRWAYLREICGSDEQSVEGTGTVEAIRLLDRLLVTVSGTHTGPGKAAELTTADRDWLLAAVYMKTYGSRIESTVNCDKCKAPYDMDFSLEELISHVDSEARQMEGSPDDVFKLPDGCRFRLPTGEDECAVLGMSPEEAEKALLERCVVGSNQDYDSEALQAAMRDIAPVLDMDMDACCPECDCKQTVHFDIQYYLLHKLMQGKRQLAYEVHRLARAYGWSLNEILGLPRSVRRMYVELVESEIES
jgi:hypothetical protein